MSANTPKVLFIPGRRSALHADGMAFAANSGLLGVVDEQGAVNFVDTTPGVSPDQRLKSRFIAHDNAAFDGAWMDNDKSFVRGVGVEGRLKLTQFETR